MKSNGQFHSDLAPVRRALEFWRKRCQPGQRIPESLWAQMAALARTHGVSPVCQALRLDYYALKTRASQQVEVSDFVEVKFPSAGQGPQGCTAEFEDRQGRKLLLRWSSAPGPELLGAVQAFLNQGA